jgi:site-specific recombinase XerD
MAAIRMLFSWLTRKRRPGHESSPGSQDREIPRVPKEKRRHLLKARVQKLLGAIETSTHTGLRDRALLGILAYTFARIGAVVNFKVEDHYPSGKRFFFALKRKAAKRKSFPCTISSA